MRRLVALLALGGALGSAGCAGGGTEDAQGGSSAGEQPAQAPVAATMTRQEVVASAEQACAETAQLIDELVEESDLEDPAGQGEFGERRLVIDRDLANSLADLDPPEEQRPIFEDFVAAMDRRADLREKILEKAAAGDGQAAEEAATELAFAVEDAQDAATDYGLPTCASLGAE